MTSNINIEIEVDDKKIPQHITWTAPQGGVIEPNHAKALLVHFWDAQDKASLKFDLWTPEMTTDEMRTFIIQTLFTMADTLERSTQEPQNAQALRMFAKEFGKRMGVIDSK